METPPSPFPGGSDGLAPKFAKEGLTFDDVLLVPAESSVLPAEVSTRTRITPRIELAIPIVSAAMDTVTESSLAIALARQGGIGIVHRNLSIEDQVTEVDRVKRSQSGMISDPVVLPPDAPVSAALELMARYKISGVPIVDGGRKLVGLLTNRDLRFVEDHDQPIENVMRKAPLVTAPLGTTLDQAKEILWQHRIEKLPIVDDSGELRGLITVKDIKKQSEYPHSTQDDRGRLRVGAAVGVGPDALERAEALVKVGVGPGSICTTRVVAGVGVPQITAIHDCAQATKRHGVTLIADGGVQLSGDIGKALAAGADVVMLGSLLSGVDESPGDVVMYQGERYKEYRGMGSLGAMKARSYSKDRYFQGDVTNQDELIPEGIEGRVAYKGPLSKIVFQLVGGLRQTMGYCGTPTVPELQERGSFIRITSAGLRESHPHDITITKESPNYW
jgi:IMP dehydrogenase